MNLSIRAYEFRDFDFFKSMFYESLFVVPGADPFPLDIIDNSALSRYYLDWGRTGDACHIVELDGVKIGAVWSRYFTAERPGYGYIDDDKPEFGIALLPDWTGQGIGSRLMDYHFSIIRESAGCTGVSLSADIRNPAVGLYKRFGFEVVKREENSLVMVKDF